MIYTQEQWNNYLEGYQQTLKILRRNDRLLVGHSGNRFICGLQDTSIFETESDASVCKHLVTRFWGDKRRRKIKAIQVIRNGKPFKKDLDTIFKLVEMWLMRLDYTYNDTQLVRNHLESFLA